METNRLSAVKRRVLCVGLVCTDIICVAHSYPVEDTDQRVVEQRWQRGGNASNNCTVFSKLGMQCEFMGTIAVDEQKEFVTSSLKSSNIHTDHCVFHKGCTTPTSIVIVNNQNGSRTILHADKSLPELSYEDFAKIDLTENKYKWIHFEGRGNCAAMPLMLEAIDRYNESCADSSKRISTSVELEKPRNELAILEDKADYLFISKEHAQFRGCQDMESAVDYFATKCRHNASVICAWGERGAVAKSPKDGKLHRSPCFPPHKVLDTLAAGDTFTAATIHALSRGDPTQEAITFGCRVAGAKVGMVGLDELKDWYRQYLQAT